MPIKDNPLTSSRDGEKVVLEGEADQVPDQEPGDLIFTIAETSHLTFRRVGADLSAEIEITLAEALCGFSRVVVKHLDGRGIHVDHPQAKGRILRPGQVIKVSGEGMPVKKSEFKGDLFLTVRVAFPEDAWLGDNERTLAILQDVLPKPAPPIKTEDVDDVEYDEDADMEEFGAEDEHTGGGWVDEDEDDDGQEPNVQCAQQ